MDPRFAGIDGSSGFIIWSFTRDLRFNSTSLETTTMMGDSLSFLSFAEWFCDKPRA